MRWRQINKLARETLPGFRQHEFPRHGAGISVVASRACGCSWFSRCLSFIWSWEFFTRALSIR